MPDPMLAFSTASVTIEGRLFEGDAAVRMKNALAREIGDLAQRGKGYVVAGIKTQHGTGFTARHVEVRRKYANSLFATIAMEPKLERPPGTDKYPANRRPYIINAILASGRYGGSYQHVLRVNLKTGKARERKVWQQGGKRRVALQMYQKAARQLRRDAANVRADLIAKELE